MVEIYSEIEKYDDIVLADNEDTYFNLFWKTATNIRWISALLPGPRSFPYDC